MSKISIFVPSQIQNLIISEEIISPVKMQRNLYHSYLNILDISQILIVIMITQTSRLHHVCGNHDETRQFLLWCTNCCCIKLTLYTVNTNMWQIVDEVLLEVMNHQVLLLIKGGSDTLNQIWEVNRGKVMLTQVVLFNFPYPDLYGGLNQWASGQFWDCDNCTATCRSQLISHSI